MFLLSALCIGFVLGLLWPRYAHVVTSARPTFSALRSTLLAALAVAASVQWPGLPRSRNDWINLKGRCAGRVTDTIAAIRAWHQARTAEQPVDVGPIDISLLGLLPDAPEQAARSKPLLPRDSEPFPVRIGDRKLQALLGLCKVGVKKDGRFNRLMHHRPRPPHPVAPPTLQPVE